MSANDDFGADDARESVLDWPYSAVKTREATAAMEAVMYTWHSEQQVTAKRSGSAMTALSSPNPEAEKEEEEEGVDLQNY